MERTLPSRPVAAVRPGQEEIRPESRAVAGAGDILGIQSSCSLIERLRGRNEMTCKPARAAVVSRPASYAALLAAGLGLLAFPVFAADPADTILVNGKIVTVDDRFTIAQGVAIRGQRIVAVGTTAKIL